MARLISMLFFLGLTPILVGCDQQDRGLVPVRGRVTMLDKPLVKFAVSFRPSGQTPGSGSVAGTDEQGSFELLDVRGEKGAFPGVYTVSFLPGPRSSNARGSNAKIPSAFLDRFATPLAVQVPAEGCFVDIHLAREVQEVKVETRPLSEESGRE